MIRVSLCIGIGALLMFYAGRASVDRDYLASAIVHEHESPDHKNRFFDLAVASDLDGEQNGGIPHIGVITAKESRMADWFEQHNGQRIALSLRAGSPLDRDGDAGVGK